MASTNVTLPIFEDITESTYVVGSGASELGILLVVQLCCALNLLHRLNGRPWRMDSFFHFVPMDLELAQSQFVNVYLRVVGWSMLVAPLITLIVWSIILTYNNETDPLKAQYMGAGTSVFLLGLTAGLTGYNVLRIRWNNFRMKITHMIIAGVTYFLFTLW
jgi:hypothetical protein